MLIDQHGDFQFNGSHLRRCFLNRRQIRAVKNGKEIYDPALHGVKNYGSAYKFFSSADLQYVDSGSIRIATAASYRIADDIADGKNDPTELTRHWDSKVIELVDQHHPFMQRLSKNVPVRPDTDLIGDHNFTLIKPPEVTIISQFDCYMICFSRTIDELVKNNMKTIFGYDMYYEINNLDEYMFYLSCSDKRLRNFSVSDVQYVKSIEDSHYNSDPFIKLDNFSWQKECRVVFNGDKVNEPFNLTPSNIRRSYTIYKI